MKGLVFTEFLGLVERSYGPDFVERLIELGRPSSGGAYTSVGDYDPAELHDLVAALAGELGAPVPRLLRTFGEQLFPRLANSYPALFEACGDAFQLLARIEGEIHAEVRKLYPDAELPRFEHQQSADGKQLVLLYRSSRHLDELAEGLIRGCLAYYGCEATIERTVLTRSPETEARFVIRRAP